MAFKAGTRSSEDAAPMRAVAGPLDDRQMVAIAAYAGTLSN
jgi:cytochrome c553